MPTMGAEALLSTGKDIDLLARLKRRDSEALGELFDSYGAVLYSLISRIVGDGAVAEVLLEETLVEVWNRSVALTFNHSALGLWIFSLARNRSIEYMRNPKDRLLRPPLKSLRAIENPRLFIKFELKNNHLAQLRRMQLAFNGLEEESRRMLEMVFFDGLCTTEIASKFQQPLASVNKNMDAVLESIRKAGRDANQGAT